MQFVNYSNDYFIELISNQEKLNNEIQKTRGYILEVLKKHKLTIPLDYLLDNLSIYSLQFIYKNYNLNEEHKIILKNYFNDDFYKNHQDIDVILTLHENTIIEHLKTKQFLPNQTLFSLKTLIQYRNEINTYIENYDNGEIIYRNSFSKLTFSEIMRIDFNLIDFYVLPSLNKAFFDNPKFKQKFKKSVLNLIEQGKYSNSAFHFGLMKKYPFTEDDFSFLQLLLNINKENFIDHKYSQYSYLLGFNNLISKEYFFQNYNSNDLSLFNLNETKKHKKLIQDQYINMESFNIIRLIQSDCSIEQLKLIFDNFFLEEIFYNKDLSINRKLDVKNEFANKHLYIVNLLIDKIIENPNISDKKKESVLQYGFKLINEFYYNDIYDDVLLNPVTNKLYEILPTVLTNNNILEILSYSNCIFNEKTKDYFINYIKKETSINQYLLLISFYKKYSKAETNNSFFQLIKENINDLGTKLNSIDVNKILAYYDLKNEFKTETLQFNKNNTNSIISINQSHNILRYKNMPYEDLSEQMIKTLIFIEPNFISHINKNNYLLPENTILSLLYYVKNLNEYNDKNLIVNFLNDYFIKNKLVIEENSKLIYQIKKSSFSNLFLLYKNDSLLESYFDEYIKNSKNIFFMNKSMEQKSIFQEQYNEFSSKKELLEASNNDLINQLDIVFLHKKCDSLINQHNFENLYLLKNYERAFDNNYIRKAFIKYCNHSSFEELINNSNNLYFVELLKQTMSYDNTTDIVFLDFGKEKNILLAKKLLPHIKNISLLRYFTNTDFAKDLAIECFPQEIFFSYDLTIANDDSFFKEKTLIHDFYSNDEVILAYDNIEKKHNIFQVKDINASYYHFFNNNYKNREKEFLELVELSKTRPKLYSMLAQFDVINNFSSYQSDDSVYKQAMNYFIKHFDFDIILKGIETILDEINNYSQYIYLQEDEEQSRTISFYQKIATSTILNNIYLTYYDVIESEYTNSSNTKYKSLMSVENTDKMITLLMKKAPLLLLSRNVIGAYDDIGTNIKCNITKYIQDENFINNFFYPKNTIKIDFLNIKDKNNDATKRLYNIVDGIIDFYEQNKDIYSLGYIKYLIKQKDFFETSLKYKYINIDHEKNDITDHIIDGIFSNENIINNINILESRLTLNNVILTNKENALNNTKKKNKI